jgi:hypothetical protein
MKGMSSFLFRPFSIEKFMKLHLGILLVSKVISELLYYFITTAIFEEIETTNFLMEIIEDRCRDRNDQQLYIEGNTNA